MNEREGLRETFYREVQEIFDGLDIDLVELEKNPDDNELLNTIFRHIHTLKGSWALFGYHSLERFTHLQEDLLGHLRSEQIPPTVDMVDMLFESFDCMRENFERIKSGEDITDERFMETSMKLVALLPEKNIDDISDDIIENNCAKEAGIDEEFIKSLDKSHACEVSQCVDNGMRLYQIRMMLDKECFKAGVDPLVIFKRLADAGKVIRTDSTGDIPLLKDFDPTLLYFTGFLTLYASKLGLDEINETLEFAMDNGHVTLHQFTPGELQREFAIEADPFWTEGDAAEVERPSASRESIECFKGEVEHAISGVKERLSSLTKVSGKELRSSIESVYHFFHNIDENSGVLELDELSSIAAPIEERLKESLAEPDIEKITFSSKEVLDFSDGVDRIKEILVDHSEKTLKEFVAIEPSSEYMILRDSYMLGELLIELGVMVREDLDKALTIQKELKAAVKEGYAPDEILHPIEAGKKVAMKGRVA
ncbi:MAG: Hpt domain-containing protein, partial [Deltaproteobacteria bacterium]|nr:Hpt domain-containing protein [Deltaproteobacteria bacterium]